MLSLFTIDNLLDELVYKQLRNFRLSIDYDGIILLIIFLNKSAACKPPASHCIYYGSEHEIQYIMRQLLLHLLFRDNDVAGITMCPP